MNDPFNLQRFVDAHESVYGRVCSELRAGRKASHWMWFIFPQIAGLGHSATARRFAISSREEAIAYLEHPVLGPRLQECSRLATHVDGGSAHEMFGSPDDLKFRSSMTLFASVAKDNQVFMDALNKFYAGELDSATLRLLGE